MAEIILGMWTSHGPTLYTTPENWDFRAAADRQVTDHPFRGNTYDFGSLVQLRRSENLSAQASLEERGRRYARCQRAIEVMANKFADVAPDVAVIFGDDQHELFLEDLAPAIAVFWGDMLWNQPSTEEQARGRPPSSLEAEAGYKPPAYTEYPGHPALGRHIIETAVAAGFDIAQFSRLPDFPGRRSSGIGHAFGFIYRKIMRDRVVPNIPILLNTYFPPNQPSAERCFELGRVVGQAIRSWPSDQKVAIFGSGGMTHFVIDEEFDHRFFDALRSRDAEALKSIEEKHLQSGTSELKNWVAAAGALWGSELQGDVVDYQPCYRSEAGTGCANGFVYWS